MSLVGRHIGRYRILEQLGQGGMSVVYKGLDTALDREVAVKVLHAHLAGKEESRRRLAREAKAVARLHHPNILEVYDFAAQDADQAYIVTEYIRGHTLRHHADATGFEPPEIAALVLHEVASALAQAHEAGIIHRDLKPENVMVRDDGMIKLMDFGIAKIIDRDDRMTMTGALVGSPAHMAPEIIEGEEAGPEADVFSLGTMLFQFATGRLPFVASNTTATLKKILDGTYDDPRQLVPTVSDDLAEIIATCLARQPTSRYADSRRLETALHGYLEPLGLGRTTEEVQAFFADPAAYRRALKPRLCTALVSRAEAFLGEKRPARALSALNQVLALEPQQARALQLLGQMNQARRRHQKSRAWRKLGMVSAATLLVVGAAGVAAHKALGAPTTTAPADPLAKAPDPVAAVVEVAAPAPTPVAEPGPVDPVAPAPPVEAPTPERPPRPEGVAMAAVTPHRPRPSGGNPGTSAKAPVGASPVEVVFKLQPYGFVEVDGTRSEREQALHRVALAPGEHTVAFGCALCETKQERITVTATGTREFHHRVVARPARVTFDFHPREAQVRVRGQTRSAGESLSRPFEIQATGTERVLKHFVDYEVSYPGYAPQSGRLVLTPGEERIQPGVLAPE
jgi:predicted Ser/Thr protein kinase